MFIVLKVGQVEGRAVNGLDVVLPTAFVKNETHECR